MKIAGHHKNAPQLQHRLLSFHFNIYPPYNCFSPVF
jgi:hypothetical protein